MSTDLPSGRHLESEPGSPHMLHIALGKGGGVWSSSCCHHPAGTDCWQSSCEECKQDTDHQDRVPRSPQPPQSPELSQSFRLSQSSQLSQPSQLSLPSQSSQSYQFEPSYEPQRVPSSPLLSALHYPEIHEDWLSRHLPTSSRASPQTRKDIGLGAPSDKEADLSQHSKVTTSILPRQNEHKEGKDNISPASPGLNMSASQYSSKTEVVSGASTVDPEVPLPFDSLPVYSEQVVSRHSKPGDTLPLPLGSRHTKVYSSPWSPLVSPRRSKRHAESASSSGSRHSDCRIPSYPSTSSPKSPSSLSSPLSTACTVSTVSPASPAPPTQSSSSSTSPTGHTTSNHGVLPYYVTMRPSRPRPNLDSFFRRSAQTRWVLLTWACTSPDRSWDVVASLDKRASCPADIGFPETAMKDENGVSRGAFIVVYCLDSMSVQDAQVLTGTPPAGKLKARLAFRLNESGRETSQRVRISSEYNMTRDPEFPAKIKIVVS